MGRNSIVYICIWICLACFIPGYGIAQGQARSQVKGYIKLEGQQDSVSLYLVDAGTGVLLASTRQLPGDFFFPARASQSVKIRVEAAGYSSVESAPVRVACDTCIAWIDTLRPGRRIVDLQEVKITAETNYIREEVDKLVYNVEADPDARNFSLLEIMRKIPLVNVSGTDNIDVNGKPFLVLVNGKNSGLFRRNISEVMKAFPAKLVKSVEIITNPSAKYDAEGVGAIINVILARKKFDGYNASIGPNLNTLQSASVVGLLTAKAGKLGYNGYFAPTISHLPRRVTDQEIYYTYPDVYSTLQHTASRNRYRGLSFNNELSIELDSLNLLNVSFSNSLSRRKAVLDVNSLILDDLSNPSESFDTRNEQTGTYRNPSVSVSYQRSFKNVEGKLFSLSYQLDNNRYVENSVQQINGKLNYPTGSNYTGNRENEKEHTIQLDYTQQLWKNEFEAGAKAIIRNNAGDYYFNLFNSQHSSGLSSGSFRFDQSVYAGYVTYALRYKKFSFRFGFRGELTHNRINESLAYRCFNAIPTVSASTKAGKSGTLKLSYSKRLERPGLSYLNPYTDISNSRFYTMGNPGLVAERSNSIELAYSYNLKKITYRATLSAWLAGNSIEPVIQVTPDSISRRTYFNIGKSRLGTLNQYFSHKITPMLTQVVKVNVYYRYFSGPIGLSNSGWAYSGDYTLNYRNKKFYRVSFNVGYLSTVPGLQGETQGRLMNYLLLGKEFFQNKLYIGCTFRNFFPKYLSQKSTFSGSGFDQYNRSTILQRNFQLNINYSFGKLKERVARPEKSIDNDDQKKIQRKE